MGSEELGFDFPSSSLSIPPTRSVTIDDTATSTSYSNVGSRDRDQRARPQFITEGGGTLEDDLRL